MLRVNPYTTVQPRLSGPRSSGTSIISYPDISLIRYGSDQPVDKEVRIIEIALYWVFVQHVCSCHYYWLYVTVVRIHSVAVTK